MKVGVSPVGKKDIAQKLVLSSQHGSGTISVPMVADQSFYEKEDEIYDEV